MKKKTFDWNVNIKFNDVAAIKIKRRLQIFFLVLSRAHTSILYIVSMLHLKEKKNIFTTHRWDQFCNWFWSWLPSVVKLNKIKKMLKSKKGNAECVRQESETFKNSNRYFICSCFWLDTFDRSHKKNSLFPCLLAVHTLYWCTICNYH